ncbi:MULTISPECIES: phosphate ABC transporter permease PstA [Alteromonadaceae]|uniref:phosphate ABC transporter permease PstA n=1 Tax=Alteromonadaceae TaxID=72275 RepID=UPI001C0910E1|nr:MULTISPECIES: phosphate ABC transporter permease PstA [Aliiglaciecola]MBU2876555.1 phosphate ABC transporter permease PstA [Aliiglaciecola lipolytica]MDO6711510.1 phosphate ABC transporter permease PstA [Aliiglaciecola sp. 2_MG-2023]MDO6752514.1 phosphate ABC transporter permease PstA [Aliiglaciecola sp. 1_MG-2023]
MANWKFNLEQKQSMATSLTAAVAGFLVLVLIALSLFIFVRGGTFFWPQSIQAIVYQEQDGTYQSHFVKLDAKTMRVGEEILHYRFSSAEQLFSGQITLRKSSLISSETIPDLAVIELKNGGMVIAKVESIRDSDGNTLGMQEFELIQGRINQLVASTEFIRKGELAEIHRALASLDRRGVKADAPARVKLSKRFYELQDVLADVEQTLQGFVLTVAFANGTTYPINMQEISNVSFPNSMNLGDKLISAISSFASFISDSPKLNNTSGGVFPALFGTIVMVLLMTILVTPFGVLAAVYLYEYAPQNKMTALIRISVNNLAGVPSVVYGVFGLGFFVYVVGASIDEVLFSDDLPAATFGAPGIFWASLTMAILTLPVVIVATEEGLRRVPQSLRDGSYALGATQAETIFKMILPIASPGIMTGVILAIARGAGEVAPLMLVGAVKFAPALPVDGEFPFVHLQRQFMHLGVLIYDGAFHSQNIGNGSSFIFACCLLLLLIVLSLNLIAIFIRNRLRKQYAQN